MHYLTMRPNVAEIWACKTQEAISVEVLEFSPRRHVTSERSTFHIKLLRVLWSSKGALELLELLWNSKGCFGTPWELWNSYLSFGTPRVASSRGALGLVGLLWNSNPRASGELQQMLWNSSRGAWEYLCFGTPRVLWNSSGCLGTPRHGALELL